MRDNILKIIIGLEAVVIAGTLGRIWLRVSAKRKRQYIDSLQRDWEHY